jgi:hypothetical protein
MWSDLAAAWKGLKDWHGFVAIGETTPFTAGDIEETGGKIML